MNKIELEKIGFVDTSFNTYTEFTLVHSDELTIQVSGDWYTEIRVEDIWIQVPGCSTIASIKELINLFTNPF